LELISIVAASAPSGNPSLVSGRHMPPAMAMTKRKPIVVVADNTIIVSAAVRTQTRKKERKKEAARSIQEATRRGRHTQKACAQKKFGAFSF
jgi:hypothetical protein